MGSEPRRRSPISTRVPRRRRWDRRSYFSRGDVYEAASGWMVPLRYSTDGPYAGWFHNEIVFGALPATPGFGGPYPESALPGTKIYLEVTHVEGPPGGVFTFWQTRSNTPSFRVPTGVVGQHQSLEADRWIRPAGYGSLRASARTPLCGQPSGHLHRRFHPSRSRNQRAGRRAHSYAQCALSDALPGADRTLHSASGS
jgi:hypothetical protein